MNIWMTVGTSDDIPRLGARVVRTGDEEIAVFRTAGDEFFALRNQCPHRGGPLAEGIVYGTRVACPLHNWSIDLASGEAVAPDHGCAKRFVVRVMGGMVQIKHGHAGPEEG